MRNLVAIKSLGKHYDSKYKFYYMSCREFAEYKKNKDVSIIGYTNLKCVSDKKRNTIDTYLVTKTENPDYFRIRSSRNGAVIRQYIHVGDNQFVASTNAYIVPLILICMIAGVGICVGSHFLPKDTHKPDLDDSAPIDLSNKKSAADIKYYDFQTQGEYTVSKDSPMIKVWNPETNTRVFEYGIYVDDELLYQTKGITPGNMIEVDCSSLLGETGTHQLLLSLSVLDENTGEVVGEADRQAVLTVE